jgi:hypothetical protein
MDEQIELLRGIWNEMKALNGRIDTTTAALHEEIGGLRSEFKEEIGGLRSEFGEQLRGLRSEFKEEIGGLRSGFAEDFLLMRADLKGEIRRNVERDLRLGTAVAELSLDVRELTGIVHAWRDEHRIDREDLRERVTRLERRIGIDPR